VFHAAARRWFFDRLPPIPAKPHSYSSTCAWTAISLSRTHKSSRKGTAVLRIVRRRHADAWASRQRWGHAVSALLWVSRAARSSCEVMALTKRHTSRFTDLYRKHRRCGSPRSSLVGCKSTGCHPVIGPSPEAHSKMPPHYERRPTPQPAPICSQPVHLPKCRQRSGPYCPRQICIGPDLRSPTPAQRHGQCSAHSATRCTVIQMRFRRVPTPQRSIRKPPQISR
jgi:hypothetical protein